MRPQKKSPALKIKHPFFKALPEAYKNQLIKFGKVECLSKGETLFRDNAKAQYFYLILKGKINLIGVEQDIRYEAEPEKRVFQTLGAGEVVGWSWATTPYRWRLAAKVEQDTELFMIDGARLLKAMKKDHELGYEIYKRLVPIMNQRLASARLKLQMFGSKPFASVEGG